MRRVANAIVAATALVSTLSLFSISAAGASFERAIELLDGGDEKKAAAELISAVRALSTPPAARRKPVPRARKHYLKGLDYLRSRYDSLAEKEFRDAIEDDPASAAAHYQLAFLLGNRGDYHSMFREFWRAVRLRPDAVEKLRGLAGLSLLAGDSRAAISFYRDALSKNRSDADVRRMLSIVLVEKGEKKEGFALLKSALSLRPRDYSVLSAFGLAYALAGDYERSDEFLRKAIKINPSHPEALGRRGLVLLLKGRTEESVRVLEEAVRLNPGEPQLRSSLAKACRMAGRLDDAASQYEAALKANPRDVGAWYELGNIMGARGRPVRAREAYEKAIALKPDFAGPYYKTGLLLAGEGNYEEAERRFKKALRVNADYASAYYALAVLNREHKKDYRTAAHYYKMYLLYDGTSPRAKQARSWLERYERGHSNEAP